MRKASALIRCIASGIAAGVLLVGCGQAPGPTRGAGAGTVEQVPAAGQYSARGQDSDLRLTALLIGDSQSQPHDGWPRLGLAAVGYSVHFCGLGGTGFVAANGKTGNYIDALQRGDWDLPQGTPGLIVIQGGGNDAAQGASDAQIVTNADRLISALRVRYPGTKLAMVGTLARGAGHGGGRRTQVDALLGTVAARHGMPFVSVGDWLTRYDLAKNLADAVHMDAAGRRTLGTLFESRLRQLGLQAPEADARVPVAVSVPAALD